MKLSVLATCVCSFFLPVGLLIPMGCGGGGGGDDDSVDLRAFGLSAMWTCLPGESCQDVYDFVFTAGALVRVRVVAVSGQSNARVAVFAPGIALNDVNLLTGANIDASCHGQDTDEDFEAIRIFAGGTYRVAICRDGPASVGEDGTYTLGVTSDTPFLYGGQTVNDTLSEAVGSMSPCTQTISSDWNCTAGESCQDVYEVYAPPMSTWTIGLANVTGSSNGRLAVYAPGIALGGFDIITGTGDEASCFGQDMNEQFAGIPISAGGVYRVAVTRDFGTSAGDSGSFDLVISSNKWIDPSGGRSVDDTQTLATGAVCIPP